MIRNIARYFASNFVKMNYFGLKILPASDSLFTIVYQAARGAFFTRALFIFYTRESSSIVSRAASFLSASFRLSERAAEKNTVMTILR